MIASQGPTGMKPVRVVIAGGGTAGWMTAAALSSQLASLVDVHLVESAEIGIVGVGEATIPHMREFLGTLGISERAFMAATGATYKLGIRFEDFGAIGECYTHPFGSFGRELDGLGFHHFHLRARREGLAAPLDAFSLPVRAAMLGRFAPPAGHPLTLEGGYGYAYHFDAARLAPFLRTFAESHGVKRTEGRITEVQRNSLTGDVTALRLEDGTVISGDLFVDCSGFRSLLLGETMASEWEDWSRWLACDRAAALPCAAQGTVIEPQTRAIAMTAGWRWRIPLRGRVGNGYVYSSAHLTDDEACAQILASAGAKPLADPRVLRFRAGRRRKSWVRNVVGIGLASGFLEPLESTSIYLAQIAIARLADLFPVNGIEDADRDEFNRLVDLEYDRIRDFLILHYHATRRSDSPFWQDMRAMAVPDSLTGALELWRRTARIAPHAQGLFHEPSWIAVLLGQGIVPEGYDPRADIAAAGSLERAMGGLAKEIDRLARAMPAHDEVLRQQETAHAA
ncbi:tryptophan halogenase family protein [Novosphingobium beihaiensis]|uniref:Tryptophan 7-halogenase n=1 Tax=Novosphingobium beihaiensis TaxID=2930389 RepID=A0ABT0BRJ4_9SPHN|nr:tryptophan halogenase family protein [Novosphingobium beihaiensis]MCJ2187682.1 tryptophan 7-halogenase [Novosphingobium beihaiensis]